MKNFIYVAGAAICGVFLEIGVLTGIQGLALDRTDITSGVLLIASLIGVIYFARNYEIKWGSRN